MIPEGSEKKIKPFRKGELASTGFLAFSCLYLLYGETFLSSCNVVVEKYC